MKLIKLITILSLLALLPSCGSREQIAAQAQNGVDQFQDENIAAPELKENLVINGSFEEGHGLLNRQWGVFSEILGWKADLESVDAPMEIQVGNIGGLVPSNKQAKLELDSHNRNGYTQSDAHIYQDINLEIGEYYVVEFDYAPRVETGTQSSDVEFYFGGDLIETLHGEKKEWNHYRYLIQADSDVMRLEFRAIIDNDTLGGYIDDVRVYKY